MSNLLKALQIVASLALIFAVCYWGAKIVHTVETTPVIVDVKGVMFDVVAGEGCTIVLNEK